MQSRKRSKRWICVYVFVAMIPLVLGSRSGGQESRLYNFSNNSTSGSHPLSGLISDSGGNLYGTTYSGGVYGAGSVFELSPAIGGGWTETLLHSFNSTGGDGWGPYAGLTFDAQGNLYGTTYAGGSFGGGGTVFQLTPISGGSWTENVLHSFEGTDGGNPTAGVTVDAHGNLYGTTFDGGTHGFGVVFELTPTGGGTWTEIVLHTFHRGGNDGTEPSTTLLLDAEGNLYGTTSAGGYWTDGGYGTVFELIPTGSGGWTEKVLHLFGHSKDGVSPEGNLAFDVAGNLYGSTAAGGTKGVGMVYKLVPTATGEWTEQVLHDFTGVASGFQDGGTPLGGVVLDESGNIEGTTSAGGGFGAGTVFELMPTAAGAWTEKLLHWFSAGNGDGYRPYSGLLVGPSGFLYGTTYFGGYSGDGMVFEIAP